MQPSLSISNSEKTLAPLLSRPVLKWIFIIFFLGLAFSAFEISLRIFWVPPLDTREEFLVRHDPLLGWRKTPYAAATHKNHEYTVIEKYNSKGLRGPEYSYEKQADEYRVLVLGDSHAEGHSVKFDDLFSEVLKRKLNERSPHDQVINQVINAGTGGYSTDQELLFFQNEGKKYQPDLTILTFSLNNVLYNSLTAISSWYKPLFELKTGELRLTRVPVPRPEEPPHYKIRRFLKSRSYVSKFLYDKISRSSFYLFLNRWGLTRFPDQFRVWQINETAQIRDSWKLTEALLVKLRQEVELSGSRFVIFYVPVAASVYPEAWQEKQNKYGLSDTEWDPLRDSRRLEEICRRHGIDFVNPVELFRQAAARNPQKNYYSFKNEHWVRDGHELAGEILFEYLTETSLRGGRRPAKQ